MSTLDPQQNAALRLLRESFAAYGRSNDPASLTSPALADAARTLLPAAGDVSVAVTLGAACWQRAQHLPEGPEQHEALQIVLDALVPHYDRDPAALPAVARDIVEMLVGPADSTDAATLTNRAGMLLRRYQRDQQRSTLDAAITLLRTASGTFEPAYLVRSNLAMALSEDDEAEAATAAKGLRLVTAWENDPAGFAAAVETALDSTDVDLMLRLAEDMAAAGRIGVALPMLERAITIAAPELTPRATLLLTHARAATGDDSGAWAGYDEALSTGDAEVTRAAALSLADLLVEGGRAEEARRHYRRAAAGPDRDLAAEARAWITTLWPPNVRAGARLDGSKAGEGAEPVFDFGRWLAYAEPAEKAIAALAGATTARGLAFLGLARAATVPDAAVADFRRAILAAGSGDEAVVQLCRGAVRLARGGTAAAAVALEAGNIAATVAGDAELVALTAMNLATMLLGAGEPVRAFAWFEKAIGTGHRHYTPAAAFGLAYAHLARKEQAEAH